MSNKGKISSGHQVLIIAMVLVFAGAVVFVAFQNKAGSGTFSASGTCPTTGLTGVQTQASYVNGVGTLTFVPSAANVLVTSSTGQVTAIPVTVPNSGYAVTKVPCSSTVQLVYGNEPTNYIDILTSVNVGAVSNFSAYDTNIKPIASPSYTITNGSIVSTTTSNNVGVANGASKNYQLTFTGGSGVFGNNKVEVIFAYNVTEYSAVTFTGPGVSSLGTPVTPAGVAANVLAGYQTVAFTIPSIQWSNSTLYTIKATSLAFSANTAVWNPVQMFLVDSSGAIINNVPQSNLFINPQTFADLGSTTYSAGATQGGTQSIILTSGASGTSTKGVIFEEHA
jgi:hypothetical protein